VHNYPRDDTDAFVTSPDALAEFIQNRAAAAYSVNKPLAVGEFGMSPEGHGGVSQSEWFRAYFDAARRAGASGAMFWILTPDPRRGYGITYTTTRDEELRAEIARAAQSFNSRADFQPPAELLKAGHHLVPRQFAFERAPDDPLLKPKIEVLKEGGDSKGGAGNTNEAADANTTRGAKGTLIYRFAPDAAARGRFEKTGGGEGYVWGAGVGFFEYIVPPREDWRRVSEIVVRAHIQPVLAPDTRAHFSATRVTLFVNGADCGSRLVSVEQPPNAVMQEWRVASWLPRLAATRGHALTVRFEVQVNADLPFGVNISNFPEGFKAGEMKPVEVEIR
jgi:hypothetical protein